MTADTGQFAALTAAVLRMADTLGELSANVGQLVDLQSTTAAAEPGPLPSRPPHLQVVKS